LPDEFLLSSPFFPSLRTNRQSSPKYPLDLVTSMKRPKAVQQNQLIGAINLRFRQETTLCRNLASKDYHADTGARSLEAAVKRRVRTAVVRNYLESNSVLHDDGYVENYVIDIWLAGGDCGLERVTMGKIIPGGVPTHALC